MQFSNVREQIVAQKYSTELSELVRAHYYHSQERINYLIEKFESEGVKAGDIKCLLALAQDFVAVHKLINWDVYSGKTVDVEGNNVHNSHQLSVISG